MLAHSVGFFCPGTTDILEGRGGESDSRSPLRLGLLTSSPLPTLQGISLHSPSGLLEASVSHVSQLGSLSVEGLELFECFHRYTVDTVLGPHPHLHCPGTKESWEAWEGGSQA